MKRYTIHLSIFEVGPDGETEPDEDQGVTLDYATTHRGALGQLFDQLYKDADGHFPHQIPDATISPRIPDRDGDYDEELPIDAETWANSPDNVFGPDFASKIQFPPAMPPDPEGMNEERAELAAQALDLIDDGAEAICDLLANLMHWCDRQPGIDFDAQLKIAKQHHWAETQETSI